MVGRPLMAKLIAIGATALIGVTGAAAATGVLPVPATAPTTDPAPATSEVSTTTAGAPSTTTAGATSTTTAGDTSTSTNESASTITTEPPGVTMAPDPDEANGPEASGPARHGLCTAFGDRAEAPGNSVAARNVAAAADAAGQSVQEFCAATPAPGRSGESHGNGDHGPTTTAPAASAPPTTVGAPGHRSDHPTPPTAKDAGSGRSMDPGSNGRVHSGK